MTIYVDESIWKYRGKLYCHMATDGDMEELHEMAKKIGLKRAWFQNKSNSMPHYDLAPSKRVLAIQHGAVQVSSTEMMEKCNPRYAELMARVQEGAKRINSNNKLDD